MEVLVSTPTNHRPLSSLALHSPQPFFTMDVGSPAVVFDSAAWCSSMVPIGSRPFSDDSLDNLMSPGSYGYIDSRDSSTIIEDSPRQGFTSV